MGFLDALFGVCIGALLTWYMLRRLGVGAAPASTTAEIERLKTVVEELTAALETKADAAEQRLTKLISEAQAVQNVLDRTLTTVGAQMVRPEASTETKTQGTDIPEPVASKAIESEPPARQERIEIASTAGDLLAVERDNPEAATPNPDVLSAVESVEPSTAAVESSSREFAEEKAEREAQVMSLVARGVTNSVELARQTGLTRGEVELILTLHNLHIAPSTGTWVSPSPQITAASIAASGSTDRSANEPPKSPDDVVVDPNDRYAAIYELIAAGVTDSVEIARRTGLGRGEVELHMGLHARRVL